MTWNWKAICCIFDIIITSTLGKHSLSLVMENWSNWSIDELENQMSPSRWNPEKTPDQVIDEYIQDGLKSTLEAKAKIPNILDIEYGSSGQKLDLYGTNLPANSPIFVFVHGGYWQEGSKEISGGTALQNFEIGVRTVVVDYTLAPNATIQEIEYEIIEALEYLAIKYTDAKIILGGHSAGAQLAAHLLHKPMELLSTKLCNQLLGFVLISGIYDLRLLVDTSINVPLKMTMENALSLSPLQSPAINTKFHPQNTKILILVGEYDSPEFIRQSEAYYRKLKAAFPHVDYYLSKSDDHFTIVQNLVRVSTNSAKKLNAFLKNIQNLSEYYANNGSGWLLTHFLHLLLNLISYMV